VLEREPALRSEADRWVHACRAAGAFGRGRHRRSQRARWQRDAGVRLRSASHAWCCTRGAAVQTSRGRWKRRPERRFLGSAEAACLMPVRRGGSRQGLSVLVTLRRKGGLSARWPGGASSRGNRWVDVARGPHLLRRGNPVLRVVQLPQKAPSLAAEVQPLGSGRSWPASIARGNEVARRERDPDPPVGLPECSMVTQSLRLLPLAGPSPSRGRWWGAPAMAGGWHSFCARHVRLADRSCRVSNCAHWMLQTEVLG
jgi:hypothetical protein